MRLNPDPVVVEWHEYRAFADAQQVTAWLPYQGLWRAVRLCDLPEGGVGVLEVEDTITKQIWYLSIAHALDAGLLLEDSIPPDPQETLQEDWEKAHDEEHRDQES